MIEIKEGDALKILRSMESNSVDIINTDPPYNVGKNYGKDKAGQKFKNSKPDHQYWTWMRRIFKECFRVMRTGGSLYVSHTDHGAFILKAMLERIGFNFVQTLNWYGRNGYSGLTKTRWIYRSEPILYFCKGEKYPILNQENIEWYTSVIEVPRPQSNYKEGRYHVCQKPIKLYRIILQRAPGKMVLDPFLGSGTTILAAIQTGKDCIGIERNPEYVALAKKRMKALRGQRTLMEADNEKS